MTSEQPEHTGRLGDDEEEQEQSSTTEGPAAEGAYDPAQGSRGDEHPVGEGYPDEAVRYDDPDHPKRDEPPAE